MTVDFQFTFYKHGDGDEGGGCVKLAGSVREHTGKVDRLDGLLVETGDSRKSDK